MQYLALLNGPGDIVALPGTPGSAEQLEAYTAFGEKYGPSLLGGAALHPEATTVRPSGDPLVVDGPYAETAEGVGGFYVFEARDLDEAIEIAAAIPQAAKGGIELRPVVMWVDTAPAEPGPRPEGTSRYVALIRGPETAGDIPDTPEWDEGGEAHRAFMEKAGADIWAGVAIRPLATATTVRSRNGEVLVSDGPYPEVSEVVGGAYVFGPVTPERAHELAAMIPAEAVELKPVVEFG